jgi:hypothetical protein
MFFRLMSFPVAANGALTPLHRRRPVFLFSSVLAGAANQGVRIGVSAKDLGSGNQIRRASHPLDLCPLGTGHDSFSQSQRKRRLTGLFLKLFPLLHNFIYFSSFVKIFLELA